jgi:hypothetical protein
VKEEIGGWVYEQAGDGRRESSSYRVFALLVLTLTTVVFLVWGVQNVWGPLSGTSARVEVVHCSTSDLWPACTGVCRPTGETERG